MLKSFFTCTKNKHYSYQLFDTIAEVDRVAWDRLNSRNNIYLSSSYLNALEVGMQDKIQFRYLTFFNNEKHPIGIAVFQIVSFKAKDILQERVPCAIADKIQTYFLNDTSLSVLICGNLYACGENGSAYSNAISKKDFYQILVEVIANLQNTKVGGSKISFSLIKEFWMNSVDEVDIIKRAAFLDFNVDVNMILEMKPSWLSFEDYLLDMNTKYRTRAKSVLKKSKDLKVLSLSEQEILEYLPVIKKLYQQVLEKAEYNLGELEVQTFVELKKALGDTFIFKGYFMDEKLIGFTTCFLYRNILDANFVGIDYQYNNSYKLYQRMLYDFVSGAIKHKKEELRFGRTAETSKSGVGALPVEMKLFAKHRNLLPSKLLKPLLSSIKPNEFELRKPFKN